MKKILIFGIFCAFYIVCAPAAVRDGNVSVRKNASAPQTQRLISSRPELRTATQRSTTVLNSSVRKGTTTRKATNSITPTTGRTTVSRATTTRPNSPSITARAASDTNTTSAMSETRTGAAYQQCKNAYFACMDQFCQLKNDNYRRCSCSDRVFNLDDAFATIQQASEKLTTFTENLDVVGMTSAQAASMRNASEGENALTSDKSASKALLQAIMNSIRGTDTSVSGKYSDLNSINMSFDTSNAFGNSDSGQIIATYNGQSLYSAVYPQCRQAVRNDCNDASLQRAINAYLMAIEQDCNTVQAAIESKQKAMKSAVREGSAMLDLARVENRQKHNSVDFTACLNAVESAILSEEVCGANYHKCLDNGEYIDISTGKPIAGVEQFYKLEQLLTFADGIDAANQKLSKLANNRTFVQNFERHTKEFAQPALDKCVENADAVWSEYLDKALLSIYYAQKSKVSEIKQGCFDFISSCYANTNSGMTTAMSELVSDATIVLQPDKIALNSQTCQNYITSCDNMFDGNIIQDYVNTRQETDIVDACRAVANQCFDKFGGAQFQNFYYPYSGLFTEKYALDWFTLYDYTKDGTAQLKSECAKQLAEIDSCKSPEILIRAFGGFDKYKTNATKSAIDTASTTIAYGTRSTEETTLNNNQYVFHRQPRAAGVATEVYNQILSILTTQCQNLDGRFIEYKNISANYDANDFCKYANPSSFNINYYLGTNEDMCPRDYRLNVATQSWGACLCWENGGRRSKWGQSPKCVAAYPVQQSANDANCAPNMTAIEPTSTTLATNWCTATTFIFTNQICQPQFCQSGDYYNTTTKRCYQCPANATCINNTFTCNTGYFRNGNACLQCPTEHVDNCNNDGFTCENNYYVHNNQCSLCIAHASCNNGTTFSCDSGYCSTGTACIPATPQALQTDCLPQQDYNDDFSSSGSIPSYALPAINVQQREKLKCGIDPNLPVGITN